MPMPMKMVRNINGDFNVWMEIFHLSFFMMFSPDKILCYPLMLAAKTPVG
jgi:hypothetical protein